MSTETIDQTGERSPRGPLGWWQRSGEFLREVRNEMKRVTWPSQREVYATTVVVILTSVFFGLYLFAVDLALNNAVQWLFQRFATSRQGNARARGADQGPVRLAGVEGTAGRVEGRYPARRRLCSCCRHDTVRCQDTKRLSARRNGPVL